MSYINQYLEFLKPERRVPKAQMKQGNIYRIVRYGGNTKKNFSLQAMHDKFKVLMDKYVKLPEFVSLKLPEIKKL